MPRKPQQTRAKATVGAIVDAGFIALSRHGYSGTSTRHIAEIAGISVGSLYEYFANKEAIYAAMDAHINAEIVGLIRTLTPRLVKLGIRDAVFELLSAFRELLERDDGRFLRFAGHSMSAEQRRQLEPIQRLLGELVLQFAMHHPEMLRLKTLPTMSYIFINGGIFTILRHLAEPAPLVSFEQLARGLADMIGHYIELELLRLDGVVPMPAGPGNGDERSV